MDTEIKVITAFEVQLVCPVCSDEDVTQPMCAYGDFPNYIFCPHCDLSIGFTPPSLGDCSGKDLEKHINYIDSRVTEFLKREEKEKS